MKKLVVLALAAALTPAVGARVWTTVYRCEETTPLAAVDPNHPTVYRDIMVGTRLVIVISSDAKGPWSGALLSSWDDRVYGELSARGYNQKTRSYDGSCLPATSANSYTRDSADDARIGFQFNAKLNSVPGEWFILDYEADQVGLCNVSLYTSANQGAPLETFSFKHVPSRDFNGDTVVDFKDFALLASRWHSTVDPDPNSANAALDLNSDHHIDINDLALFSEYWLERTDCD